MFISGYERRIVRARNYDLGLGQGSVLGLFVTAAYRPVVLRTSLTSYVLNAESGRQADALISYTPMVDIEVDVSRCGSAWRLGVRHGVQQRTVDEWIVSLAALPRPLPRWRHLPLPVQRQHVGLDGARSTRVRRSRPQLQSRRPHRRLLVRPASASQLSNLLT